MIFALLLSILPLDIPVRETVYAIEVNTVYADDGTKNFTQLLFRSESGIIAYRIVKERQQQPVGKRVVWLDGRVLRDVRATSVQETHYQWDVELYERELLPLNMRRGLYTP